MLGPEAEDSSFLPSFSELSEIIGSLSTDVEDAKKFSDAQLESLILQLNEVKSRSFSLIEERDEALSSLSILKEERDQLHLQVQVLSSKLKRLEEEHEESVEARKKAEFTLLQLHQVQEDLEHYFLLTQKQSELLSANEELQGRFSFLLANSDV